MKRITVWLLAVTFIFALVSCGHRKGAASSENCFTAIDKYLTETIGSQYLGGDVCIPFHDFASVDESNPEDIQVLGSFWVFNYNIVGDTLKTVSGGSHPGKMHVLLNKDGHYEVTAFDAVADGSDNIPTAKSIFGDKFSEFQAASSDDAKREQVRKEAIAAFVEAQQLPVSVYQDFGWPAVSIK